MRHTKSNTKITGFSLVEVMFAILFAAIIILGATQLQTSNLILSRTTAAEGDAYFYANRGASIAEAVGSWGIAAGCNNTFPCTAYLKLNAGNYSVELNGPSAINNSTFTHSLIIDSDGLTNAYRAVSHIQWTDNTGDHTVDVKRIIF